MLGTWINLCECDNDEVWNNYGRIVRNIYLLWNKVQYVLYVSEIKRLINNIQC